MPFLYTLEENVDPADALSIGATLVATAHDDGAPAAHLYGATLRGEATVLGTWQRTASVLGDAARPAGRPTLRRRTGGPTYRAGAGVVYAALALRHASALMDCPLDRILNRNVRGFLGALSGSGEPAHYFGREWLSVRRMPVAFVGWARLADGGVLVEAFIGVTEPALEPKTWPKAPRREEAAMLGKGAHTLEQATEQSLDPARVLTWLPDGFGKRYGTAEPSAVDLAPQLRERAKILRNDYVEGSVAGAEGALSWSKPHEVPIGFLEAGLARDAKGQVTDVRLAGDFFQDDDADQRLTEALVGGPAAPKRIEAAINQTFDGHAHVIEGLKSLQPVLDALLEVAE